MNPYETIYNTPHNLNFMDKSTTAGGENRTSMMTVGNATENKVFKE